jgi:hypothetical protein
MVANIVACHELAILNTLAETTIISRDTTETKVSNPLP